ncbi:MAG: hypothetical protein K1X86_15495 [Ignavibacteria bacterium]|nr:hypothetical protein [Ignavibacteria bacterium]
MALDNIEILSDTELIKAAISVASGGQLSAEQYNEFISTVVKDDDFLASGITVYDGIESANFEMDTLGLESRILRKGVEGTAPAATEGVNIARRTLSPKEYVLAFDITDKFLRRNIQKGTADETIKALFMQQCSNDLVDLCFNGDTDSGEDFLDIMDGLIKRALADAGVHKSTFANGDTMVSIMDAMLASMPKKWRKNKKLLKFYMSPDRLEQYKKELREKNTQLGDAMMVSDEEPKFNGVEIETVGVLDDKDVFLTRPNNFAVGFGLKMTIEAERAARKRATEYTVCGEVDFNYVVPDMLVYHRQV